MTELRDYQDVALHNLRILVSRGERRIVMQAPTGAGKTRLAVDVVQGAMRKGKKVAFVVPALSLIDQAVEMFEAEGVTEVGVIQAKHVMTDWSQPVQVCSIQTIGSRKKWPQVDVVVFDEVHIQHKAHWYWLDNEDWQQVPFIGLSATPWSKGLGKRFKSLLVVSTTERMIADGWLSPYQCYAPAVPDLNGVKTVAGDYHEGQLAERMNRPLLVADLVSTYRQRWGAGKTIVFCVDCAHAQAVQEEFQQAGVAMGYQDALTDRKERMKLKQDFHAGTIAGVCSVGTMIVGIDWDVRCVIWARPTRSEILWCQGTGRGLRTAEGKDKCVVLDHAGNALRLGLPCEIHHETLDDGKARPKAEPGERLPKLCKQCQAVVPRGVLICPNCGHVIKPPASRIEVDTDGSLQLVGSGGRGRRKLDLEERKCFYAELQSVARQRGYKPGYAAAVYKERIGKWPPFDWQYTIEPEEPSLDTLNWLKYKAIAWYNRRNAAA